MSAILAPGSWRQDSQKLMGTLNYMVNSVPSWATWQPISKKKSVFLDSLKWAHATTTSQIASEGRVLHFISTIEVCLLCCSILILPSCSSLSQVHHADTSTLLPPSLPATLGVISSQSLSAFSSTPSSDILTPLQNILCAHYDNTHVFIASASWPSIEGIQNGSLSQHTKGRHSSCYFTCLLPSCSFPGMYILFWAVLSKPFLRLR